VIKVAVRSRGNGWDCDVSVASASFRVSVESADLQRWGRGDRLEDVADLVRRSFEFLLEREPPESILSTFDLAVIQRYFPEYDRLFKRPSHLGP
jgi:hypothetical protein